MSVLSYLLPYLLHNQAQYTEFLPYTLLVEEHINELSIETQIGSMRYLK